MNASLDRSCLLLLLLPLLLAFQPTWHCHPIHAVDTKDRLIAASGWLRTLYTHAHTDRKPCS